MKNYILYILFFFFRFANPEDLPAQMAKILSPDDDYVKTAAIHFENGNWEGGKIIMDKAVKEYPKDSDVRMLLGRYYYEKRRYDPARYELLESLRYNRHNVNAKQILVNVEMDSKRYSSAICYINELLEVNPYWKGLWLKKIEAYRLQGNIIEANRQLSRLYQIYPMDEQIKEAYFYYLEKEIAEKKSRGEIEEAISIAISLIAKSPQNEKLYIDLVNTCIKAGDYGRALMYAERGINNIPESTALINKKTDILGEQNRYDEALTFLQSRIKTGGNTSNLQRQYNLLLEESARHQRRNDPYILYKNIYSRNPNNEEAFNYIINNALANNDYEDALEFIRKSKERKGETKEILLKEQDVYTRMGAQSKVEQLTVKLFQLYPDDYDIKYQYTLYRMQQAKDYMSAGSYYRALEHWMYVAANGEPDEKKIAMASVYNCAFRIREFDIALGAAEQLAGDYPGEPEWRIKKASVYAEQGKYTEALTEYGYAVGLASPQEIEWFISGYDEFAAACTKKLIGYYLFTEAQYLVEQWLEVNPRSDMGLKYAMNISMQSKDYDVVKKYASVESQREYGDISHIIKLAQAHDNLKEYEVALEILLPYVRANPYHKDAVATYSQVSEDYAHLLIKNKEYDNSMAVLDTALLYDPHNTTLKYWKGTVYEKMHAYDSAYYYQSFYPPGLMELKPFRQHMDVLKHKTYVNEVGFYYLHSRYNDLDVISYITTVEYTRFAGKNTYAGRINYSGRQPGKGIQGQIEWSHIWKPRFYTRFDAALANKFFPSSMISGYINKGFGDGWEAEPGASYRRMADGKNMVSVVAGASKELEPWWLNARFNSIILDKKYYYSLFAQSRFYYNEGGCYITAMMSFGSAPDVDVIDNQLYNGFSVTNSMVGLGARHLISDRITLGLLGNWYNYEDKAYSFEEENGKYRNLYNLYLQLHVRF